MYRPGELIIYGAEGVCRVENVGPIHMRGAKEGVDYYTLSPLYREGTIFAPVDTSVQTRPILTREQAEGLIDRIHQVDAEVYETTNPRLLNEHYQLSLKSSDCMELVRLIRSIYVKGRHAADKGRRLGQVDERSMKRAQEMLHGELAAALSIPVDQVAGYIASRVQKQTRDFSAPEAKG